MNEVRASEADALFAVLRQSADPDAVAAIEVLVRSAPDRALNRVNVLDFATEAGLDQGQVIAADCVNAPLDFMAVKNALAKGRNVPADAAADPATPLKTITTDS